AVCASWPTGASTRSTFGSASTASMPRRMTRSAEAGINPSITVTEAADGIATAEGRARFLDLIRSFGFDKPRLKVLPLFRIGAEAARTRAYDDWERIAELSETDAAVLQCSSCRMVTSKGVYVCPILI